MKKFILCILPLLLSVSCNSDLIENCIYRPQIIDDGGFFTNNTNELFLNFDYPKGVFPVLYYTGEVKSELEIGVMADDIFEQLSQKPDLYPYFEEIGFLIVISDTPELIQVRLGKKYSTYCNLAGITVGPDYLRLQQSYSPDKIDQVLGAFLTYVSQRIRELQSLPATKRSRLNQSLNVVENVLNFLGTPSENLYGKFFLRPVLILLTFIYKGVKNWFWSVFILLAILCTIRTFINKVIDLLIKNQMWINNALKKIVKILLAYLFPVASAGAACVLSRGRMEDYIAMNAMGVPFLEQIVASPENFIIGSSKLMVMVFVFLWTINLSLSDYFFFSLFPPEQQKDIFNKLPNLERAFLQVTEDSIAPFSENIYGNLFRSVLPNSVLLATAAYYVLPQIIIWLGIFYALSLILNKGLKYYDLYKKNISTHFKIRVLRRLKWSVFVMVIVALLSIILLPKESIVPLHKDVDYSTIQETAIKPSMLVGNYTFKTISEESQAYSSAVIRNIGHNKYMLSIHAPYSIYPLTYIVEYVPQYGVLFNNEIGKGIIHYNRKLDTIKITFTLNEYQIWEISK